MPRAHRHGLQHLHQNVAEILQETLVDGRRSASDVARKDLAQLLTDHAMPVARHVVGERSRAPTRTRTAPTSAAAIGIGPWGRSLRHCPHTMSAASYGRSGACRLIPTVFLCRLDRWYRQGFRACTQRHKRQSADRLWVPLPGGDDVEAQRAHFEVALANIVDAVITTDARGRITYLNRIAESLSGWTISDAAGRPLKRVFSIIHDDDAGTPIENPIESLRHLRQRIASDESCGRIERAFRPGGHRIQRSAAARPPRALHRRGHRVPRHQQPARRGARAANQRRVAGGERRGVVRGKGARPSHAQFDRRCRHQHATFADTSRI